MNTKRSKINEKDLLLEDVKTSERKKNDDGEDSDPHNMLSQSLRNIVNNEQISSLLENNILHAYSKDEQPQ